MKYINKILTLVLVLGITLSMGCLKYDLFAGRGQDEKYTALGEGEIIVLHVGEDLSLNSFPYLNIKVISDEPVDIYLLKNENALQNFYLGKTFEHYEQYEAIQVVYYNRKIKETECRDDTVLIIHNPHSDTGKVANIKTVRDGNLLW